MQTKGPGTPPSLWSPAIPVQGRDVATLNAVAGIHGSLISRGETHGFDLIEQVSLLLRLAAVPQGNLLADLVPSEATLLKSTAHAAMYATLVLERAESLVYRLGRKVIDALVTGPCSPAVSQYAPSFFESLKQLAEELAQSQKRLDRPYDSMGNPGSGLSVLGDDVQLGGNTSAQSTKNAEDAFDRFFTFIR